MVEISIELGDIVEGEKLKDTIIANFEQKGLLLPERHAGLHLDDMPEITSLSKEQLELTVRHNDTPYTTSILEVSMVF